LNHVWASFGVKNIPQVANVLFRTPAVSAVAGTVVVVVGVVSWPEMAEPALGADEQEAANSRATRMAVTFRMCKASWPAGLAYIGPLGVRRPLRRGGVYLPKT